MKMILVALLFVLALVLVGCTDAQYASRASINSEFTVEFFQNGELIRSWTSTDKPLSGEHGTRFAFVDKATKKYIRVGVANTIVTQN